MKESNLLLIERAMPRPSRQFDYLVDSMQDYSMQDQPHTSASTPYLQPALLGLVLGFGPVCHTDPPLLHRVVVLVQHRDSAHAFHLHLDTSKGGGESHLYHTCTQRSLTRISDKDNKERGAALKDSNKQNLHMRYRALMFIECIEVPLKYPTSVILLLRSRFLSTQSRAISRMPLVWSSRSCL